MKTLKSREFVQIKNVAIVVAKSMKAKEKAWEKLCKAEEEYENTLKDIDYQDAFVYNKYGLHIDDVVQKVVTKYTDKEGRDLYKTEFKATDKCVWNEEKKLYEVEESKQAGLCISSIEENPDVEAVIGKATP